MLAFQVLSSENKTNLHIGQGSAFEKNGLIYNAYL
jgi:hypothetical protein